MRIDLLLNKLCLTKTRTIAKNACDKGLVLLNGKAAKASAEVKEGDVIGMSLYGWRHELRVERVPVGNIPKKDAPQCYTMLSREKLDD